MGRLVSLGDGVCYVEKVEMSESVFKWSIFITRGLCGVCSVLDEPQPQIQFISVPKSSFSQSPFSHIRMPNSNEVNHTVNSQTSSSDCVKTSHVLYTHNYNTSSLFHSVLGSNAGEIQLVSELVTG